MASYTEYFRPTLTQEDIVWSYLSYLCTDRYHGFSQEDIDNFINRIDVSQGIRIAMRSNNIIVMDYIREAANGEPIKRLIDLCFISKRIDLAQKIVASVDLFECIPQIIRLKRKQ